MSVPSNERHIPWFNPREMADSTVVALAIGREKLLQDFIAVVSQRLKSPVLPTTGTHWLVTGQRGAGKSFFLRYAQIKVPRAFPNSSVRFVLLPEELRNVRAPHDLLDEIRRMLKVMQVNDPGRPAMWRAENPEKSWKESLEKLLAAFSEPLLIVGIENFGQLLDKAFSDDVAASLLRKLMEHEARILFLATAVDGSFDDDYGKRLYRQFEKHPLPNWDGQMHRKYLEERARLLDCTPTPRQLARIDAYSRYTGGNARVATILAATILDDIVDASSDLNATIDRMSDYYRALLDALPENSETLLDALIRGGEPCSQTQLAERVGARQNDISRAFAKLLEAGYLHAHRPKGQKETRYQVADRLFVQWYRMRYLGPGQRSRLAVLADLLANTITLKEKWFHAERFATHGEVDDALSMANLALREIGQLCNRVCDTQWVEGIPQAYAAGRELLINLIERTNSPTRESRLLLETSISYLFISMLNIGMDLSVLQDLAQDLPGFAPADDELTLLAETLTRWFGELRNPNATNTPPPDPDWATTVAALNKELPLPARLRLGLTEAPRLSPEAASAFTRTLALIK